MPTTTEKGLGWEHQKQRKRLLAHLKDGEPCGHCGKPMHKSQALDADHTVPRSLGGKKADRLIHASCNRSRGNGTRVPTGQTHMYETVTSRDW